MTSKHALISGAGVAGTALAWWLARYGWRVTVVERSPELRTEGQNVDVRGAGRDVLRRMDLDEAVGEHNTTEVGTRFVDENDETVGAFPASASGGEGATAEREILRGQLVELLHDASAAGVDYRFGVWIDRLARTDDATRVTLSDRTTGDYDVVVIAEGVRSRTRDRAELDFGAIERRALGLSIAYYAVDRTAGDDRWWRWYNAPGGRSVTLRPDNVGRERATLSFRSEGVTGEGRSLEEQKTLLRERFADVGWEVPRLLDALERADDLYVDDLVQIRAERWSDDRVCLLGDAAYCATPVSGMGTSLAIVGAYVLAGELAAHVHHRDAFAAYERVLRPYVAQAQNLPPGTPTVVHPRSRAGVAVLRLAFRLAASGPLRAFQSALFSPPADRIELPDYAHLVPAGPAPSDHAGPDRAGPDHAAEPDRVPGPDPTARPA